MAAVMPNEEFDELNLATKMQTDSRMSGFVPALILDAIHHYIHTGQKYMCRTVRGKLGEMSIR
jgi:hypothetical protein